MLKRVGKASERMNRSQAMGEAKIQVRKRGGSCTWQGLYVVRQHSEGCRGTSLHPVERSKQVHPTAQWDKRRYKEFTFLKLKSFLSLPSCWRTLRREDSVGAGTE